MERSYKIAGLVMNVQANELEQRRYRVYEIAHTDQPQIIADGDWKVVKEESPRFTQAFCQYSANSREFYGKLLDFNGMILHSSALLMDGKAYLFTADSGTGKSTHTSLYRRVFGDDRVRILNDDKPAIRLEDGQFFAYGTPWSGKSDMNLNLRAPVGGICVLRRGEQNVIKRLTGRSALFAILGQTIRPREEGSMEKLLELTEKLLGKVPVWEMYCNMDPEAACVSYAAMSGEGV